MGDKDYHNLRIWQKADQLAKDVYLLTKAFPKEELFSLTSQLQRASLSIPTNIVEGFYRGRKEFAQFLVVAIGSLKETEYLLDIANQRGYIKSPEHQNLQNQLVELSKMISVFLKKIRLSPTNPLIY